MADVFGTIFNQMLKSQKELNDEIFPEWLATLNKTRYMTAVLVELGEAISSLDYKWWKAGNNDWDNFKVELVDILHFLLSALWFDNEVQRADACYFFKKGLGDRSIRPDELDEKDEIILIENNSLKLMKVDNVTAFLYLGRLFRAVNLTELTMIAKEFVIKNVLNLFRTRNGYKEGTYIKDWNGQEDNVIAWQLSKELHFNKHFNQDLYNKLERYYNENVKIDF